jgi:hypothetical protein
MAGNVSSLPMVELYSEKSTNSRRVEAATGRNLMFSENSYRPYSSFQGLPILGNGFVVIVEMSYYYQHHQKQQLDENEQNHFRGRNAL